MSLFLIGLAVFFIPHFYSIFRSRAPGKDLRETLGFVKYMGLYSLISLAGFVMLIMGYIQMRPSPEIYTPPSWGPSVNYILMLLALIFLAASQMPAGHIKARLKHPMLVSVKIWALGHLLSNGELNAVILFGLFLAYAVIDRIAVKRRAAPPQTSVLPSVLPSAKWDGLAIIIGLGLYVLLFMGGHVLLFGVGVI